MPHFAPRVRDVRPLEWLTVGLFIAAIVGSILFVSLAKKQSVLSQANQDAVKAGLQAHNRQCKLLPASLKLYDDANARGVISDGELALITSSAAVLQCTPSQKRATR